VYCVCAELQWGKRYISQSCKCDRTSVIHFMNRNVVIGAGPACISVYFRRETFWWLYSPNLTPWSRVLLERLTVPQLVKKFNAFSRTRRFITAFTSAHQLSLSWVVSIQSLHPHTTSWRSVLILFSHLLLGLLSGLIPSGLPTKSLCAAVLSLILCIL
jgi:hypothetical protein